MLKRRQLFEFCDQRWLRGWLREAYMDCMNFVHQMYSPYHNLIQPIMQWATQTNTSQVLDLCSGGGIQITHLLKTAAKQGVTLPTFILSDLYPNVPTWRKHQMELGKAALDYSEQPISALAIDSPLRHWSIFTALHHFPPHDVRKLFRQCVEKGDSLCVVEATTRRWADLAQMVIFAFPSFLVVPFFATQFKWSKFLMTTLIPVVPFMAWFDGIVSDLRSYTKEEIIALLPAGWEKEFEFHYREVWWRFMPAKSTMFLLVRKKQRGF